MTEIKLYQCDICGTRYTNEEITKECENNHVTKLEIVDCIHWKKASCEDGFTAEIQWHPMMEEKGRTDDEREHKRRFKADR